jgi:trehalose 6-phosphate phosphatase
MTAAGGPSTAELAARADQVALCLDFDGTLSPIVPDPEAARPLEGMSSCSVPWPPGSPRWP